jgi:hypothetical protein
MWSFQPVRSPAFRRKSAERCPIAYELPPEGGTTNLFLRSSLFRFGAFFRLAQLVSAVDLILLIPAVAAFHAAIEFREQK